jgi:hypothetical protein
VEESGWTTESALWNSSPEICRQDLAAGFSCQRISNAPVLPHLSSQSPDGVWTI